MLDAVVKGSTNFCLSSKVTKLPSVCPRVSGFNMHSLQTKYLVTPKKGIPLAIFVSTPQLQDLLTHINCMLSTLSDSLIPE